MLELSRTALQDPLRSYSAKQQIGAFYTPPVLTSLLAGWAIQDKADTVFEPSFGGCGFLESVVDRLKQLGNEDPISNLYGADVDEGAFINYLLPKFESTASFRRGHFFQGDFLSNDFQIQFPASGFRAILGNPPYLSYHKMREDQRNAAAEIRKELSFPLFAKASYWVYFLLKSLQFMDRGGRIALILPGSSLQADYSKAIGRHLADRFKKTLFVRLAGRYFRDTGTDVDTVILLADDFGDDKKGSVAYKFAIDLNDAASIIGSWDAFACREPQFEEGYSNSIVMSPAGLDSLRELTCQEKATTFGAIADVRIGIVTGANAFFIIDQETARKNKLPISNLTPILSKFSICPGLTFRSVDWTQAVAAGVRCTLVDTRGPDLDVNLKTYLKSFDSKAIESNATFNTRPVWHRPTKMEIPDGFFPYMLMNGPRVLANSFGTISTNSIHRVFIREADLKPSARMIRMKMLALLSFSTLGQLSAELNGRSYGSGTLKIEPSEAKNILLLVPDMSSKSVSVMFERIDRLLRALSSGIVGTAQLLDVYKLVDTFILEQAGLQKLKKHVDQLSRELIVLRSARKKIPTKVNV